MSEVRRVVFPACGGSAATIIECRDSIASVRNAASLVEIVPLRISQGKERGSGLDQPNPHQPNGRS